MTLPDERIRAIKNTREFLRRLLDPKATPKVPKSIRTEAYWCLRHYPGDLYLNDIFTGLHFEEVRRTTKKAKK